MTHWWQPQTHAERRPLLLARNKIKTALRAWFADRNFVEVEPSILQRSPGNETHIHAFQTALEMPGEPARTRFLHTSPEFACKKLLAAGETRIFSFGPTFRNGEASALHLHEFTMLEWYRADADYHAMMADCLSILQIALESAGADGFRHHDRKSTLPNPDQPPSQGQTQWQPAHLTVCEAFRTFANIDLAATLKGRETDRDALASAAIAQGYRIADDDTWSDIFSRVLVQSIESELGMPAPVFLLDYPVAEAALARVSPNDPKLAERFELYVCGVELANGFSELTDAREQRRRFAAQMDEKARIYGTRYPIDESFLHALDMMPPAAGCALGFDRLVMLTTGATRIEQVVWTPLDIAP